MHLADNASNAMPQGGQLRIETAAPPVASTVCGSQLCAILTISDTGVGMNEITLGHIFEPFFSTKNTTVASGLGLSTVHGIVAQSKGRIDCQSSPGKGTTFRIYLPIAADQPVNLTASNNGFRILLAEDDPVVNKHLTHSLRKAGFSVDSVCNGEEALIAFGRHFYHMVVTDVLMPKIGGLELARRLRQLVPSLPVILISGSNAEESVLRQLPDDHIVYLQKPFSSSQLVVAINDLLSGITVP
jgi:CheY-like chemotaxis protein